MFKTISAALLAVSMIAAPAMAAGTDKTATAPVTTTAPVAKTAQAPAIIAVKTKPSVMNANARMGRHHYRHHHFRRHFHKHMGALKSHQFSKVSAKHIKTAIKRG